MRIVTRLALLLLTLCSVPMAQTPIAPESPSPASEIAATRAQLEARRDDFARVTGASGLACAISVPKIVVQDVPSFGSYDPDTNTLTSPAWNQMSSEEKAIFMKAVGPNGSEKDARAEFEAGVHHWVIVHELGHWWEACRGVVDRGDHYGFELQADRIAAAYWREQDSSVNAHQKAVFEAIVQKWPNPVPPGQEAAAYFNRNYEALAPTPAYIWFQAQMCLTVFQERPLPSFEAVLALQQHQTRQVVTSK